MKYLFFDIECSVVSKTQAKICAFGYCLTDEQFNIVEKEDILINPKGGFHLTDRKGTQGLVLPYEYDKFKSYPTFMEVKDKIYALLEDNDTLVAGHATMNDVKYLNLETKRFQLPSFCFSFIDTQFIYMNKIGEFQRQFGLGTIAEQLGVQFTAHRAVDDAYATMKIAQAMCQDEGVSLPELLRKYNITAGKICNYEITQNESVSHKLYLAEALRQKEEREKKRAQFHVFIDKHKRKRAKDGLLKGLSVCFSHSLELQTQKAEEIAQKAFSQAAFFTFRAEECNLYICDENETGLRRKTAEQNGAKILTPDELERWLSNE